MKKMIWFTTLFICFILFVVPVVFALLLKVIPGGEQPGYNGSKTLSIYGGRNFKQKFISEQDNLAAIGTSIKNPNLNDKQEIILDIRDQSGNLVRTTSISGRNVQDGDFIRINFSPILDSKNKTYIFTLSSPQANPDSDIEIFLINSATKDILEYTYDNQIRPGGLPMVTFYKPVSKLQTIREIYSNLFSRLVFPYFQKH